MAQEKAGLITFKEAKRWLRQALILERQKLRGSQQRRLSQKMTKRFVSSPLFKKAKSIACFIGFGSEVLTEGILEAAWKQGKEVVIPMTTRGFSKPYFAVFHKGDSLIQTKYGPFEMKKSQKPYPWKKIDVVLVPGLAFDRFGTRLGYGGGVYDRILERTAQAAHVGLFFSSQQRHKLPREAHDKPLHHVVTDLAITTY